MGNSADWNGLEVTGEDNLVDGSWTPGMLSPETKDRRERREGSGYPRQAAWHSTETSVQVASVGPSASLTRNEGEAARLRVETVAGRRRQKVRLQLSGGNLPLRTLARRSCELRHRRHRALVAFLAKSDNPEPPGSASNAKVALSDDGIGLTIGQEKPEAKGSL
jgi:hypothetical protein